MSVACRKSKTNVIIPMKDLKFHRYKILVDQFKPQWITPTKMLKKKTDPPFKKKKENYLYM